MEPLRWKLRSHETITTYFHIISILITASEFNAELKLHSISLVTRTAKHDLAQDENFSFFLFNEKQREGNHVSF